MVTSGAARRGGEVDQLIQPLLGPGTGRWIVAQQRQPVEHGDGAAGDGGDLQPTVGYLRGDVRPVQLRRTQHHQFHAL